MFISPSKTASPVTTNRAIEAVEVKTNSLPVMGPVNLEPPTTPNTLGSRTAVLLPMVTLFKKLLELESNMTFDDVGEPDGATVDINNNYWSARVRGKCILCINTENGKIIEKIELPTNTPTCVTFGDTDLSSLYVTSLRADPVNDAAGGNLHKIKTETKGFKQLLTDI
mgnify:CR=1 FL=1